MPRSSAQVSVREYRPTNSEPFMNERQREYFRNKLLSWREEILQGSAGDAPAPSGREPEPSRLRRPRVVGNRPRDRASGSRPPAQADRQDRCSPPAHRRRHLRLLRGDRRADQPEAPRRAADRDLVDRGSGAARAPRAGLPRRLSRRPARNRAEARRRSVRAAPCHVLAFVPCNPDRRVAGLSRRRIRADSWGDELTREGALE